MKKLTLIAILFCTFAKSEPVYHTKQSMDHYCYYDDCPQMPMDDVVEDVIYSGYDKNGKYLVLIDRGFRLDINKWKKQPASTEIAFFEYRCIEPKTAIKSGTDIFPSYTPYGPKVSYIGERDKNCDCKDFNLYERRFRRIGYDEYEKILVKSSACIGFVEYSYEDFKYLEPFIIQPPEAVNY